MPLENKVFYHWAKYQMSEISQGLQIITDENFYVFQLELQHLNKLRINAAVLECS